MYRDLAEALNEGEPPAPPVWLPPWSLEDETLLLEGRNEQGAQIYAFVRIHPDRLDDLRTALESGTSVHPQEWGSVIASGQGEPTPRTIAMTGIPEHLFQVTPRAATDAP
jgi:hypothetical protein